MRLSGQKIGLRAHVKEAGDDLEQTQEDAKLDFGDAVLRSRGGRVRTPARMPGARLGGRTHGHSAYTLVDGFSGPRPNEGTLRKAHI